MYSINGVALDNPELGWSLRAGTKPLSTIVKQLREIRAGRDGVAVGASDFDAIDLTLVVSTSRARLRDLYALFTSQRLVLSLTGTPTHQVEVVLASATPVGYGDADKLVDSTFIVTVPGVFWRTAEVTTPAQALTAASVVVRCLNADGGISAPVGDAIVRVKGQATAVQVTDSSGAWFTFDAIAANEYLRFHSDTGRAFLTGGDLWSGGVEVSGRVDFGGPRNRFEIAPFFPSPRDPTSREGRLTVATTARAGASIQVRARAAHLV